LPIGYSRVWRPGLFDVIPQDVADQLSIGKFGQPVNALLKISKVGDVKPARINGVAGKQDAGAVIVESEGVVRVSRAPPAHRIRWL
jgi:hypothetical protein